MLTEINRVSRCYYVILKAYEIPNAIGSPDHGIEPIEVRIPDPHVYMQPWSSARRSIYKQVPCCSVQCQYLQSHRKRRKTEMNRRSGLS